AARRRIEARRPIVGHVLGPRRPGPVPLLVPPRRVRHPARRDTGVPAGHAGRPTGARRRVTGLVIRPDRPGRPGRRVCALRPTVREPAGRPGATERSAVGSARPTRTVGPTAGASALAGVAAAGGHPEQEHAEDDDDEDPRPVPIPHAVQRRGFPARYPPACRRRRPSTMTEPGGGRRRRHAGGSRRPDGAPARWVIRAASGRAPRSTWRWPAASPP